mmetsp:Transcript_28349/g.91277  ORF Transcript_28349/g.91277 Transcript_28349/m.91277 type:complete len:83 (-) Transcript_28349:44-292(-)
MPACCGIVQQQSGRPSSRLANSMFLQAVGMCLFTSFAASGAHGVGIPLDLLQVVDVLFHIIVACFTLGTSIGGGRCTSCGKS